MIISFNALQILGPQQQEKFSWSFINPDTAGNFCNTWYIIHDIWISLQAFTSQDHKLDEANSCKKSSFRLYRNFSFLFCLLTNSGRIECNYKLVCQGFFLSRQDIALKSWSKGVCLPHSMQHKSLSEYRSRVRLFQTAARHGHKKLVLEEVTVAQKHGTKQRIVWFDGLSNSPSSAFYFLSGLILVHHSLQLFLLFCSKTDRTDNLYQHARLLQYYFSLYVNAK